MDVPMYMVDAFTDVPFSGNPAAVCLLSEKFLPDSVLQKIAAEMNLSETAFVTNHHNDFVKASNFGLRWFTPTNEVPLCGHATLASAAALFKAVGNTNRTISFATLSGDLHATNDKNGFITLDLPLNEPIKCEDSTPYAEICDVMLPNSIDLIDEIYLSTSTKKLLIKMKTEFSRQDLKKLCPNTDRMMAVHDGSVYKGVIVTTQGGVDGEASKYDFLSRYFAPWNGIPEDSVTGSAHTVLAPFWGKILKKREMLGRQCSLRGGDVKVKLGDKERVDVGGPATVVMSGKFYLPLISP